jgi:hypothetical protein
MENRREKWFEYLNRIELFYKDRLDYPLDESVYTLFGALIFNPNKPLDEEVKTVVINTYNLIY